MSEYLDVTGYGPTRDESIHDADQQAEQYFGIRPELLDREIGRAIPDAYFRGKVLSWAVSVEYKRH